MAAYLLYAWLTMLTISAGVLQDDAFVPRQGSVRALDDAVEHRGSYNLDADKIGSAAATHSAKRQRVERLLNQVNMRKHARCANASRACLEVYAGRWEETSIPTMALGSKDRYRGCYAYGGLGSVVSTEGCKECRWKAASGDVPFRQITREITSGLLDGKWVAVMGKYNEVPCSQLSNSNFCLLGDSLLRFLFSDLVYMLDSAPEAQYNKSMEAFLRAGESKPPDFPRYDMHYNDHSAIAEKCDGVGANFCQLNFITANGKTRVTFHFLTTAAKHLEYGSRTLSDLSTSSFDRPDYIIANSGAWDFYPYDRGPGNSWAPVFASFVSHKNALPSSAELNLYKEQFRTIAAQASSNAKELVVWVGNMIDSSNHRDETTDQILVTDALKRQVLDNISHVHLQNTAFLSREHLFKQLPSCYAQCTSCTHSRGKCGGCRFNGYHMPGLLADESLAAVLNMISTWGGAEARL
jgi:hypothetical protein